MHAFRELSDVINKKLSQGNLKAVILIQVNAAAEPINRMGAHQDGPNLLEVILRSSDLLLQRATEATKQELDQNIRSLQLLSDKHQKGAKFFCFEFGFRDVDEISLRLTLNSIPTRLHLSEAEVDTLIQAGRLVVRKKADALRNTQNLIEDSGVSDVYGRGVCK